MFLSLTGTVVRWLLSMRANPRGPCVPLVPRLSTHGPWTRPISRFLQVTYNDKLWYLQIFAMIHLVRRQLMTADVLNLMLTYACVLVLPMPHLSVSFISVYYIYKYTVVHLQIEEIHCNTGMGEIMEWF